MSGFDSLLEDIRAAYAEISEIEEVARAVPGDRLVALNLSSLKRHVQALERSWEDEARYAQKEICRYRILPHEEPSYRVRSVTQSLEAFQDLFSQIFDAVTNKTKQVARIPADIARQTAFNVGFTYPGSLGFALTIDGESQLFSAKYDDVLRAFVAAMKLESEQDVRGLATEFGLAVVKRTYDWSKANALASYSVDVNWLTSVGHRFGSIADPADFQRNVDLIGAVSDVERESISIFGTLVGIDTKQKRFRFVQLDGPDYIGSLSDAFPIAVQWAVNTNYVASIEIESKTSYATQETKRVYRLRDLKFPTS